MKVKLKNFVPFVNGLLLWGQCLDYAFTKWNEFGGQPHFRTSEHWPIAHVKYADNTGVLSHFVPANDKLKTPVHSLVWFWGEVSHHDFTVCRPMPMYGVVISCWLAAFGSLIWAAKTLLFRAFKLRTYP